jgi:phosphomannomutase
MTSGATEAAGARLRDLFANAPKELGFGTSGLRGLVAEITDLEAWINTRGFLSYLFTRPASSGGIRPGARVAIAGDLRPSTDGADRSILRAVAQAVKDSGCEVEFCGRIPTPALTLYGITNGIASIMVTGSHIPFDRNGIKFNRADGEVLKEDEAGILEAVRKTRAQAYDQSFVASLFRVDGFFKTGAALDLPPVVANAERAYVARYREAFPENTLDGFRLLFYQHSAVGRELVPAILEALGAEVVRAGRSETFIPIDTEDVSDKTLDALERLAHEHSGPKPFDAVVSTDGDSDRPLLCGIRAAPPSADIPVRGGTASHPGADGHPVFFGGDLLGLVTAEFLEIDAVVVPISANDAVEIRLAERSVPLVPSRIGSPHVIRAMRELRAKYSGRKRIAGWEANGGFLLGSALAREGRPLAPLPTRDAVLPIISVLAAAKRDGLRVEELFDRLPRRFGKSGIVDNFDPAAAAAILRAIAPRNQEINEYFATVSALMTELLAFDRIVKVNTIDGVRLWSKSGDVVHFRPSGNAPQFRVYACANSPERAASIVANAIREPDGAVRQLERRLESL